LKFAAVHRYGGEHCEVGISTKPLAAQGFRSHAGVLAAEGKIVRDHGDELTIEDRLPRGFATRPRPSGLVRN